MAGAPVEIIESYQQKLKQQQDTGCRNMAGKLRNILCFPGINHTMAYLRHGAFFGLYYSSVESVLNMMGFNRKRKTEIFEDIRIMENAALEVLNKDKNERVRFFGCQTGA